MNDALIVLSTYPDVDSAKTLARHLVSQGLAACCNIVPAVTSIYSWNAELQEDTECLVVIKTSIARSEAIQNTISREHPYDLPEIVCLPITDGSERYLQWIAQQTQQ